jgi:hypothetical protein
MLHRPLWSLRAALGGTLYGAPTPPGIHSKTLDIQVYTSLSAHHPHRDRGAALNAFKQF